jgi:uncharacterized protein YpmB
MRRKKTLQDIAYVLFLLTAIILLFFWYTSQNSRRMEEQNKVDVNYVLNEGMRRADQKINLWIGKVDNLSFGNLLKTDNGGNSNEN